jgi:hypothetical protein
MYVLAIQWYDFHELLVQFCSAPSKRTRSTSLLPTSVIGPVADYSPCSLELINPDTIFFSHNKTASAGLSTAETISRRGRLFPLDQ